MIVNVLVTGLPHQRQKIKYHPKKAVRRAGYCVCMLPQ